MNDKRNGLTYAQAGVDIDAGNRMVELIKPLVRATARPGADAEIGGFGGLFDLKRAGFQGPGPGRRNRRRRHQADDRDRDRPARHDRHRPGRDVGQRSSWCRAPSRCSFSTISPAASSSPRSAPQVVQGIAAGLPRGALRADRRRDRRDARALQGAATTISRALRSARSSATQVLPRGVAAGDVVLGLASSGPALERLSRSPARWSRCRGCAWDAPCPFAPGMTLGEALLDADAHLCALVPRGDPRDRRRQGARAHHRRRLHREHSARAARRASACGSILRACRCCRCSSGSPQTGGIAEAEMLRTFNCGIGMIVVVAPDKADARRRTCSRREGETVARLGEVDRARSRRAARRL